MDGKHWLAFGIGVAVGVFVVPMILSFVRGMSQKG